MQHSCLWLLAAPSQWHCAVKGACRGTRCCLLRVDVTWGVLSCCSQRLLLTHAGLDITNSYALTHGAGSATEALALQPAASCLLVTCNTQPPLRYGSINTAVAGADHDSCKKARETVPAGT
jgi:hypothetical protein